MEIQDFALSRVAQAVAQASFTGSSVVVVPGTCFATRMFVKATVSFDDLIIDLRDDSEIILSCSHWFGDDYEKFKQEEKSK
jgi:hypothetical protein